MNKLKFLYDVVKTLRNKEVISGVGTVEVQKDQVKIFQVKNQFTKNLVTMQTTATITSEVDYEGKQVKHQSTTEFTNCCQGGSMRHKLFKHMHHNGCVCGGIKAGLSRIAFVLGLLNSLKVEEQENKKILVNLEMDELPEEIKTLMQERMGQKEEHHEHGSCCFKKELCCIEKGKFSCTMSVSKEYEIEKIVVTFDGIQQSPEKGQHTLGVVAELILQP